MAPPSSSPFSSGQMRAGRWYDVSPRLAEALGLLSLMPKPVRTQLARWLIRELTGLGAPAAWMLTMTDMPSSTSSARDALIPREQRVPSSSASNRSTALTTRNYQRTSDACPEVMALVGLLKRLPRHLHVLATNKLFWALRNTHARF